MQMEVDVHEHSPHSKTDKSTDSERLRFQ